MLSLAMPTIRLGVTMSRRFWISGSCTVAATRVSWLNTSARRIRRTADPRRRRNRPARLALDGAELDALISAESARADLRDRPAPRCGHPTPFRALPCRPYELMLRFVIVAVPNFMTNSADAARAARSNARKRGHSSNRPRPRRDAAGFRDHRFLPEDHLRRPSRRGP